MKTRTRILLMLLCTILSLMTLPLQAQSSNSWSAQFFNNTSFSGTPTTTAIGNALNLNWSTGAPVAGVGVDNWTARFNTISYFNAGTYRFVVHADDAVRLYVHGQLLLDTINNPKPDQVFMVDFTMGTGNAGVQVDFREYTGVAFVNVNWYPISITPPTSTPQPIGAWSAQFFNNTTLSGTGTVSTRLDDLRLNWGTGTPVTGIGVDNWSARFTGTPYFSAGWYRFTVNADDAFRLIIGNRLVLETFNNPRPNTPISVDIQLYGGNTFVQVDYREYIGPAFLYVAWQPITAPTPTPQQPMMPMVTINTGTLNFRSAPVIAYNIIGRVHRGESYPLLARNAYGDWLQIRVGNTVGWVYARYVMTRNASAIPIIEQPLPTPAPVSGYTLRANANLNIRSGPGITFSRLNVLPYRGTAAIIGRNSSSTWWQIQYAQTTGWVSGAYVTLPANLNRQQIPVR